MRKLRFLPAILLLLPFIAQAGSGFKVNGTDLDSIFAPYHAGWPQAAATGFKVGGVDLNARYAPLSTGSAAAATKYKTASGQDLNAIFAALGTTNVQVATQPSAVSGSTAAGNPSGTVTSNATSTAGTKGGGSYSYSWHLASGQAVSFTNPSGPSTAVTYSAVPAGTTYSGTMYCTISDGVTSINTNTVAWSLQNTTPPYTLVNFSLTAGTCSCGSVGYANGLGTGGGIYGTINSPSGGTLPSGKVIAAVFDNPTNGAEFVISNFVGGATDPGKSSLYSVTINGRTYYGANATYVWSGSGWAGWYWGPSNTWGFASGSAYSGSFQKDPNTDW